jgi:hypothetical protein
MQERLRASVEKLEQIARWGDLYDATRPADPKRNVYGFTQGDRYRYRVTDQLRRGEQSEYGWRIDDISDDGDLIVNGGSIRLNRVGQILLEHDTKSGTWTKWEPPLALFDAGLSVGQKRELSATRTEHSHSGLTSTTRVSGSVRAAASERISTPAGTFDTLRIEAHLQGFAQSAGRGPSLESWRHKIWYAPSLGLWVAWEEEGRNGWWGTSSLRRLELVAYDMAKAAQSPQLAGASR